jgi:hypothetical protein
MDKFRDSRIRELERENLIYDFDSEIPKLAIPKCLT